MQIKRKNYVALALVVCMACMAAGCGKKGVAGELQELNNEEETVENIPTDALKYEVRVDGRSTQYKVDAEVVLPKADKVGVYEEQLMNLTEDKVVGYAKTLFDGGSYEQKKPYAACSREELEALKQEVQNAEAGAVYTYVEDKWRWEEKISELDFYLNHYIEPKESYEEGKYYNCQYYEAAKTDDDLAGYLLYYSRIMILEGAIGGTPYQLVAYQADPEYGDCTNSYLKLYRENEIWSQCSWQATTCHYSMSANPGQENVCEISEEEAANSAMNYMGMMGFEDMELVHTEWLYWQRSPIESQSDDMYDAQIVPDGYSFYIARACNGVSGTYMPIGMEWLSGDGSSYAEQDIYKVDVSSEGVISVECGPLYENTGVISEDAEMLSFDDINKKAMEAFEAELGKLAAPEEKKEDAGDEGTDDAGNAGDEGASEDAGDAEEGDGGGCMPVERGVVYIKWVKLNYINLQYNGKFRLTPVWIYASYTNDMQFPEIMINALDGTRVKENDNEYKCIH